MAEGIPERVETGLLDEVRLLGDDHVPSKVRAAAANCLLNNSDRMKLAASFVNAGWSFGGEGQWIEGSLNDVWVTLLGDDQVFTCLIDVELPQAKTSVLINEMIQEAEWQDWEITSDQACKNWSHPAGYKIFVKSGGNDPVCTNTEDSRISIFKEGE